MLVRGGNQCSRGIETSVPAREVPLIDLVRARSNVAGLPPFFPASKREVPVRYLVVSDKQRPIRPVEIPYEGDVIRPEHDSFPLVEPSEVVSHFLRCRDNARLRWMGQDTDDTVLYDGRDGPSEYAHEPCMSILVIHVSAIEKGDDAVCVKEIDHRCRP